MDTSNSQEKMVAINLHKFLLGGRVKDSEISSEIWAAVINYFIRLAKPYLSYIDGLRTIQKIIADGNWPTIRNRKVRICGLEFAPESLINKNTRGFFICVLEREKLIPPLYEDKYRILLLSEKGEWILWVAKVIKNNCTSHLILLNEETGLSQMLKQAGCSGYSVMDSLYLLLFHSLQVKEKRTKTIRELFKHAEEIKLRVDINS